MEGALEEDDRPKRTSFLASLGGALRGAFGEAHRAPTCLIFLDVDGVLNSQESRQAADGSAQRIQTLCLAHDRSGVDHELLQHLLYVVRRTRAAIVLSSTWRLHDDKRKDLTTELEKLNIKVLGATPDLEQMGAGDRVDEIQSWLKEAKARGERFEHWIAIDDLDLLAMNEKMKPEHFVRTSDATGLTMALAEEAVAKLIFAGSTRRMAKSRAAHISKEKIRVIFLDVDGVLNRISNGFTALDEGLDSDAHCLDVDKVGVDRNLLGHLQHIVQKTEAVVVLSSSWWLEPLKKEGLHDLLERHGIRVIGHTPDFSKTCEGDRVDEIRDWLHQAAASSTMWVAEWVAIDDVDLLAMNSKLMPDHFVKTSRQQGLSQERAEEAVSKLSKISRSQST